MRWLALATIASACAPEATLAPGWARPDEQAATSVELGEWAPLPRPSCAAIPEVDAADFSMTEEALEGSNAHRAGLLDDEFRTEHLIALRRAPGEAECLEAEAGLDPDPSHAVSSHIRRAAELAGDPISVLPIEDPLSFDAGLDVICRATTCGPASGALPEDLAAVLGPVLAAVAGGLAARAERDAAQSSGGRGADWWRTQTGNGLIFDPGGEGYDATYPLDRAYLAGDRSGLYGAAAQIAHAIESIDWAPFAGRTGIRFDMETAAGAIRVRDAAIDEYRTSDATLLLIDLGGDDIHRDEVASNLSGANAVSVAVDVMGDDDYGYVEDAARYEGDERFGSISLSTAFRQGAARNGIAMLFDLDGDDVYRSLRGSQGYAHQGVGVLFDGCGNDHYRSEAVSQGAAQLGIGLLIDLEGHDAYESVYASQGFGFVGGVGIAHDREGDDAWTCDDGAELELYRSPQLPGRANTSFCQGAGLGSRTEDPTTAMSGGLGVLRDREGDDAYSAAVYAQGAGYWQGVGVLSDGAGDDRYDARYYAQGAGVHYAAGVLIDRAGDDVRGESLRSEGYSVAAGLDFGVGVLLDLDGKDSVRFRGLGVGAASDGSLALYLDREGDDRYRGGHPGRSQRDGRSLMIDRTGADSYEDDGD